MTHLHSSIPPEERNNTIRSDLIALAIILSSAFFLGNGFQSNSKNDPGEGKGESTDDKVQKIAEHHILSMGCNPNMPISVSPINGSPDTHIALWVGTEFCQNFLEIGEIGISIIGMSKRLDKHFVRVRESSPLVKFDVPIEYIDEVEKVSRDLVIIKGRRVEVLTDEGKVHRKIFRVRVVRMDNGDWETEKTELLRSYKEDMPVW